MGAIGVLIGCTSPPPAHTPVAATPAAAPARSAPRYVTSTIALPGATADGVAMDYLLYDPRTRAVWVPAGNTGTVDVIAATGEVRRIEGFATREVERRGAKHRIGPSAAALGPPGVVYVGNRGDSSVCAVDETRLAIVRCGRLDALPDGVIYVAATHEVWVTTPRDRSIRVLDETSLAQKARLAFEGQPEGFAVDPQRGRFYTNLEDRDVTLAVDLASRATLATWPSGCGEAGPRGIRWVEGEPRLLVACGARVEVLDAAGDGRVLGSMPTGDGVDDIDYEPSSRRVFAGGGAAGSLTIGALGRDGSLTVESSVVTARGARNGVVDGAGRVYLAHSQPGEIVVVNPAP
jgi:DNA-binding beta-propeller fold protein YncE